MEIDSEYIVCASRNTPFHRLQDDILILDEQAGYCYSMNSTGARIWELLFNPISVGSLSAVLCNEFALEQDECALYVKEFVGHLVKTGLATVNPMKSAGYCCPGV